MVKKAALLLLAALFVLTAAACGSGASANVTTQEGLEAPEGAADFLTAIYTTDQGGRYTAYLEATEDADDPDSVAAAMANYYGSLSFSDLVTEELLNQLIANRVPFNMTSSTPTPPPRWSRWPLKRRRTAKRAATLW